MKSLIEVFIKLVLGLGTTLEIIGFSVLCGAILGLLLLSVRTCSFTGRYFYGEIGRAHV